MPQRGTERAESSDCACLTMTRFAPNFKTLKSGFVEIRRLMKRDSRSSPAQFTRSAFPYSNPTLAESGIDELLTPTQFFLLGNAHSRRRRRITLTSSRRGRNFSPSTSRESSLKLPPHGCKIPVAMSPECCQDESRSLLAPLLSPQSYY